VIVVDASAVLELLLATSAAKLVSERLLVSGETLHAPHLIDLEVAQALRRYSRSAELAADRGVQALSYLAQFPLTRYRHDVFLARIWELRHNLTAYDAAYVALAETLDAPLVTRDQALASAFGHRAKIELI